jgi:hypothetical protein
METMLQAIFTSKLFWYTVIGALIGLGYNRLGQMAGST